MFNKTHTVVKVQFHLHFSAQFCSLKFTNCYVHDQFKTRDGTVAHVSLVILVICGCRLWQKKSLTKLYPVEGISTFCDAHYSITLKVVICGEVLCF